MRACSACFWPCWGCWWACTATCRKTRQYLVVFLQYFLPAVLIVYAMLERIAILNLVLAGATSFYERSAGIAISSQVSIRRLVRELNQQEFVFFTKGDNVANLNKVMTYVEENEFTNRLKIVMLLHEGQKVPEGLLNDLQRARPRLPQHSPGVRDHARQVRPGAD